MYISNVQKYSGRKTGIVIRLSVLIFIFLLCNGSPIWAQPSNQLDIYNVIWQSPSQDSWGSMPIGNGDIGLNVWVEQGGDLLFYIGKTDAWSENCRLLKLGRVRVKLTPNPFAAGLPFKQELILKDGKIRIEAGNSGNSVSLDIHIDANHPVIHVSGMSESPVDVQVDLEVWRTSQRTLTGPEIHSAYGLHDGPDPIVVEPDDVLSGQGDQIVWYHRNDRSIWADNLTLQALGHMTDALTDPLLNRTFGGLIKGAGLQGISSTRLQTPSPTTTIDVAVYPLTAKTATATQWKNQVNTTVSQIEAISIEDRQAAHINGWRDFWNRHYIYITSGSDDFSVSQAYLLQRWISACSGRGNAPIKFNGSIFVMDLVSSLGDVPGGYDADYRKWGGPYWFQNTRLSYWPMLYGGDFELMQPLFDMYLDALTVAQERTQVYYGHEGAFFPETMYFWGMYTNANYGWDRTGLDDGYTVNDFIRYYWSGGLELSLMMLDYYAFTQDEQFAQTTLVPLASEILTFFDQHWGRDAGGKIRFDPAMALETWRVAVNPLPEIVGIDIVAERMLALPEQLTTAQQRTDWTRLRSELPPIPTRTVASGEVLAPAQSYSINQNSENPELYAIFPYRKYGLGKPDLDLAIRTFDIRDVKDTGGWRQDSIKAALLGLTDTARNYVVSNANNSNSSFRFPTMWGPNFDWVPDQDHGTVTMNALQRMLIQTEGDTILLLPAWPTDWDVAFRVYAPQNTVIEGVLEEGCLTSLNITPASRKTDITIADPYCNCSLPYDLNKDCVQNLADLKEFASHWLENGLFPDGVQSSP